MLKLIPLRKGFLVGGIKIQIVWKWFPVSKFEYGRHQAGALAGEGQSLALPFNEWIIIATDK